MKKRIIKLLGLCIVTVTALIISAFAANAALVGDVTGADKKVTAADARLILRVSVALDTLTEDLISIADANEDGKITAADARDVLRMSVGLETVKHYCTKTELKAPTCTEPGRYLRTCTECSDKYEEDGKPLGHNYPTPEVLKQVTCDTDGLVKYTCKRCGESKEEVVNAGHVWEPAKATCTQSQYCLRGNHAGEEALGHTTSWGKCTRCNIFITDKYAHPASVIKEEIPLAAAKSAEAYDIINKSIGAAGWLKEYASQAKPVYQAAKASYQAAYDVCGDIAEFASIKANLEKALANTDKILSQIDVILATSNITDKNYTDLAAGIDTPQWANDTLNTKLQKAITW